MKRRKFGNLTRGSSVIGIVTGKNPKPILIKIKDIRGSQYDPRELIFDLTGVSEYFSRYRGFRANRDKYKEVYRIQETGNHLIIWSDTMTAVDQVITRVPDKSIIIGFLKKLYGKEDMV